jgi:hypothetical protein
MTPGAGVERVRVKPGGDSGNSIVARMNFCIPGEKVIFYPTDRAKSQWPYREHEVRIADMRPIAGDLALEHNGFVLVNQTSAVSDFFDAEEVERKYVPEVIDLLGRLTGADKVITFGTMVRTDAKDAAEGNLPAYGAHVDYGDRTVRQFATDVLGKKEAARWLECRYMLINVWRPISVVRRAPFAVCDARTVDASDMNDSEVRGGLGDPNRPTLYGFAVAFNPEQRWYYVPQMRPDEVLIFKLFDSDPSAVQWSAHSAFEHPDTPPDAPPRQSIEMRTIAFFRE